MASKFAIDSKVVATESIFINDELAVGKGDAGRVVEPDDECIRNGQVHVKWNRRRDGSHKKIRVRPYKLQSAGGSGSGYAKQAGEIAMSLYDGEPSREACSSDGAMYGVGGVGMAAYGSASPHLIAANGIVSSRALPYITDTLGKDVGRWAIVKSGGVSGAARFLPVCVFGVQFALEVKSWYKGEIDGQQLGEKSVEHLCAMGLGVAGGYGGAIVGAEIGAFGGPVGMAFGAIVGGIAGGITGGVLGSAAASFSIDKVFGGPGDQRARVRKSFDVLGLPRDASPEMVGKSYKQLAKQCHPDKGGSKEEFVRINVAYETLRVHFGAS